MDRPKAVAPSLLHRYVNQGASAWALLKTVLYYRLIFGAIGSRSRVFKPLLLSNPQYVYIGDHTYIRAGARIETIVLDKNRPPCLIIGNDVSIEQSAHLVCSSRVVIGNGSVLSANVYINDCDHGLDPRGGPIMKQPLIHGGNVSIGKNCFLGLRVAIMPGVTLGDHCVVGLNSVVTRSFPPYSMIWGSPARLRRRYDPASSCWLDVE